MSKSASPRSTGDKPAAVVAHAELSATEPHFVAPELVEIGPDGPVLVAGRCKSCGAKSFPKAQVCTECLSQDIGSDHLAREGVLYSFSVVHQAPKGWSVPYVLGYVDLPDGIRVLAHIDAPPAEVAIDQAMRLGTARVGTDEAGAPLMSYVFTPTKTK